MGRRVRKATSARKARRRRPAELTVGSDAYLRRFARALDAEHRVCYLEWTDLLRVAERLAMKARKGPLEEARRTMNKFSEILRLFPDLEEPFYTDEEIRELRATAKRLRGRLRIRLVRDENPTAASGN